MAARTGISQSLAATNPVTRGGFGAIESKILKPGDYTIQSRATDSSRTHSADHAVVESRRLSL